MNQLPVSAARWQVKDMWKITKLLINQKQLKVGKNKHIFAIRRILQLNDECRTKYGEVIQ
jgi:hypothetical protein